MGANGSTAACPYCGKPAPDPEKLRGRKILCAKCHGKYRLAATSDGVVTPIQGPAIEAHEHETTEVSEREPSVSMGVLGREEGAGTGGGTGGVPQATSTPKAHQGPGRGAGRPSTSRRLSPAPQHTKSTGSVVIFAIAVLIGIGVVIDNAGPSEKGGGVLGNADIMEFQVHLNVYSEANEYERTTFVMPDYIGKPVEVKGTWVRSRYFISPDQQEGRIAMAFNETIDLLLDPIYESDHKKLLDGQPVIATGIIGTNKPWNGANVGRCKCVVKMARVKAADE